MLARRNTCSETVHRPHPKQVFLCEALSARRTWPWSNTVASRPAAHCDLSDRFLAPLARPASCGAGFLLVRQPVATIRSGALQGSFTIDAVRAVQSDLWMIWITRGLNSVASGTFLLTMAFFSGFQQGFANAKQGEVFFMKGGSGAPLFLLHGHPRTHATWEHVAPLLAQTNTVVCPDLPGFGQSYIPADAADSSVSSKRAKAIACVELMRGLGFENFSVVGHD